MLLDILDLSAYWGFIELNDVTQTKIIVGNFINPITYGDSKFPFRLVCWLLIAFMF